MAALYISNEVRIFLHTGSTYYELVVAPGFTFNQNSTSETINATTLPLTRYIAAVPSTKVVEKIKTEFEPATWNFTTFVRPVAATGGPHDTHNVLWRYFLDNALLYDSTAHTVAKGHNNDRGFNTGGSMGFFDLFFKFPDGDTFKVSNCAINSAAINMELGSITSIQWEGFGTSLDTVANFSIPSSIANSSQIASASPYAINKLSSVAYTGVNFTLSEFSHPMISGSVSLTNNITPISYPILGEVTKPFTFEKGMPTATGSFSGYLEGIDTETQSKKFTKSIRDSVDPIVEIDIRAGSATTKSNIHINIPFAYLDTPTLATEGVFSFSASFSSCVDGSFITNSGDNTAYKVFYS